MEIVSIKNKKKNMAVLLTDDFLEMDNENLYFSDNQLLIVDEKDFENYINLFCSEIQQDVYFKFKEDDIIWKVNGDKFLIWKEKGKFTKKLFKLGYNPLIPVEAITKELKDVKIDNYKLGKKEKNEIFDIVDLDYRTNNVINETGKLIFETFKETDQELFENQIKIVKLRGKKEISEALNENNMEDIFSKAYKIWNEEEKKGSKFDARNDKYVKIGKLIVPNSKKQIECWNLGRNLLDNKFYIGYVNAILSSANVGEMKKYIAGAAKRNEEEKRLLSEKIIFLTNNVKNKTTFDLDKLLVKVDKKNKEKTVKERNADFLSSSIFYLAIPIWESVARATKPDGVIAFKDKSVADDEKMPYEEMFKYNDWHQEGIKSKASLILQLWPITFNAKTYGGNAGIGSFVKKDNKDKKVEKILYAEIIQSNPSVFERFCMAILNNGEKSHGNDVNVGNIKTNFRDILYSELASKNETMKNYELLEKLDDEAGSAKRKYLIFPDNGHFGWNSIKKILSKNYYDEVVEIEKLFSGTPKNILSMHSIVLGKNFKSFSEFLLQTHNSSKSLLKKAGVNGYYKSPDSEQEEVVIEKTDDLIKALIVSFIKCLNIWDANEIDIEKVFDTL